MTRPAVALHPETVAAYVAKYATKAAADLGAGGPHESASTPTRRSTEPMWLSGPRIAGQTGPDAPYKGWRRWADMLGFRGHFASKSRRYSTTLGPAPAGPA